MQKLLTRKQIKRFLGKEHFREAMDHHKRGSLSRYSRDGLAGGAQVISGHVITAPGKGNGQKAFPVELQLDGKGFVTSGSCGCTADFPCPHQGALLLCFLEELESQDYPEPVRTKAVAAPPDRKQLPPAASGWQEAPRPSEPIIYKDVSVKLTWEPETGEGGNIRFSPLFHFSQPSPVTQSYRNLFTFLDVTTGDAGLYLEGRNSLWLIQGASHDLLKAVVKTGVDISHISGVRRRTERIPSIEIDFPFNSYTTETIEPPSILNLQEFTEGISLSLSWKIGEKEIPFDGSGKVYFQTGEKGSLHIIAIPEEWKKKIFLRVRRTVEHVLIRESDRAGSFNFTARIPFGDYIATYGLHLLEEGFELRRKGKPIRFYRNHQIAVRIGKGEDWFELEVGENENGRFRKFSFSDDDILSGYLKDSDGYIALNRKAVERIRRLQELGMDKQGSLKIHPWNPLLWKILDDTVSINEKEEGINREIEKIREAARALESFSGIREVEEGSDFQGELRPYQRAGLSWLLFLRDHGLSGCLADDMGLGKTVQALALLQISKAQGQLGKVLIVAPVSTLPNWESEIDTFTPNLSHHRHHGSDRVKVASLLKGEGAPDIILTSYATLRNDIQGFGEGSFGFLILDEAQAFKNPASQTFRAVKKIQARHRFSLTGTPLENNLLELWSQFDVLMPGLLGSRNHFIKTYCTPSSSEAGYGALGEEDDKLSSTRLKTMIRPFILRRTKKLVAPELPEKEEILLYAEMEEEQERLYIKLREYFQERIHSVMETNPHWKFSGEFLEGLLRLRQAAIFPSLISDEYRSISSCKFTLLQEKVEEIVSEGNKVIIFSQFTGALKLIRDFVKTLPCGHLYLDGQTKKRDSLIRSFQEDGAQQIFLISLKAGGGGINLTAADYVIIFDPWWNPAVERQAVDRAHRIGRTEKVIAYRFLVRNTVEEKILTLQERKRHLSEEVITEETSFFKSLQKEDLEYLFS